MGKRLFLRLRTAAVMVCICGALCGSALAAEELVPAGQVVGIQLDIDGVLVAGLSEVNTAEGAVSPAKDAGIREGDIIVAVDGRAVRSAEDLLARIACLDGDCTELIVERGGRQQSVSVAPAVETDGEPRLGLWLREGIAGLGTVTYIDPESGAFGALGHGVNDAVSGVLLPLEEGSVCRAQVVDIIKGTAGEPGELAGCFEAGDAVGELQVNTPRGIFGYMEGRFPCAGEALPVAEPQEIRNGPAIIRSCVAGQIVAEYDVHITRTGMTAGDGRDLIIRVTDPELLALTGGIVQGMSGSPIIQDGKLIGAVTHVLVNDPTTGYGIFIENMLDAAG